MRNRINGILLMIALSGIPFRGIALGATEQEVKLPPISWAGYGEAFYTYGGKGDCIWDVPRACLLFGMAFGKDWAMETDVALTDMKHIALDQFYIEKTFRQEIGLRVGYMTMPVGVLNVSDDPFDFFTVNRPECEDAVMPYGWNRLGISLNGAAGFWEYGLVLSYMPKAGAGEKGEEAQEMRNDFGVAFSIDNFSFPGLRMSLSGFYGLPEKCRFLGADGIAKQADNSNAFLAVGWVYGNYGLLVRGNADVAFIHYEAEANNRTIINPAYAVEAGYDVLHSRPTASSLYLFGRYEYYKRMEGVARPFDSRCDMSSMSFGLNYIPVSQIVLKAQYTRRFGASPVNEFSIGLAFSGGSFMK